MLNMTVARVYSANPGAIKASLVTIETDVTYGLFSFSIVGLPGKDVDESRDRVTSAIKNSGFPSPKIEGAKIITSLLPANITKSGSHYDLGIALSYLLATKEISFVSKDKIFIGELSLSGDVLPVSGVLSMVRIATQKGYKEIYLPDENKEEASLVSGIKIYPVKNLLEVVEHFSKDTKEKKYKKILPHPYKKDLKEDRIESEDIFSFIKGQDIPKRALLIAATGGHNIAFYGPPGTGKTMLAKALREILPPLTREQMLEVTSIHSYAGVLDESIVKNPPFRNPHHTSSPVSLTGGGATLRPGEITLAHKGVLFLDEFPEFEKRVIEALRQPLEDGVIYVSRAKGTAKYPAEVLLVAAMNPCPCGYRGGGVKQCTCKETDLQRYKRKISGPITDRIDLWVEVSHIPYEEFKDIGKNKSTINQTEILKEKVLSGRNLQIKRHEKETLNANLKNKDINRFINLTEEAEQNLITLSKKFTLSPRVYQKIKKIARTIADLENSKIVEVPHILEAFEYRPKE